MAVKPPDRACIVGCGRWLRRDDQIGLRIVEHLAQGGVPGTRLLATESPCADLLSCLDGVELLVVVDAARSDNGHPEGDWRRIEYRGAERSRIRRRPRSLNVHQLSVDAALELADRMELLPKEVWVYAVAVRDVDYGEDMSPAVARVTDALADEIRSDVAAWLGRERPSRA